MSTIHDREAERLIRQVESRVRAREEIVATVRGVAATLLIFGVIVTIMLAMLTGAVLFATALEGLGH